MDIVFRSVGEILVSTIARSSLRLYLFIFKRGCTILHSHKQQMRVFSHFFPASLSTLVLRGFFVFVVVVFRFHPL